MDQNTPSPMPSSAVIYDREATMAAIDRETMVRLADELLGVHRGTDRSPMWPCPVHEGQTGRTPPLSIFTDRFGEQRWKCHACGEGGTAIDLLMQARGLNVRDALGELARRTRTPPLGPGELRTRPLRSPSPAPTSALTNPFRFRPIPELDRYVDDCSRALWRHEGRTGLGWLTKFRGLPERTLRRNRVGLDLGWRRQPRPEGVPKVRKAIVLPVLVDGGVSFVQLRILDASPDFPKYLNAQESFAPNPRLGSFAPTPPVDGDGERSELLVTEGIIDALSASAAGFRSVACLGAGYPDRAEAVALARLRGPLVIAFDPDHAGQVGARRLVQHLAARRREAAILPLPPGTDLNACAARSHDWPVELAARVEHATYPLTRLPPTLVEG